jgi:uncharacterized membrane protein YdjX (TVP38/TMEM64 family)
MSEAPTREQPPASGNRRILIGLAVAAALGLAWASGAADYLSLDSLRAHRQTLAGLVASHPVLSGLAYVMLYVAVVALSLPGGLVLTLSGGFLFGPVFGTGLTVVGATIGACLVFLFARTVLGEAGLDRLGPKAAALAENIRRNAWSYLMVLRLVPLFPFVLVNLVPAFAGVPFLTFAWTTLVGILPGTAVFSLAGSGLGRVLDEGGSLSARQILTPDIIAGLVGLGLLSLAAIPAKAWIARRSGPPQP